MNQPTFVFNSLVLATSSISPEMDSSLGILIRKIANLHDGLQVEVFRSIARFPAITLPVLEMTGNEIARVFESSRKSAAARAWPITRVRC
jgi:hypothetical protein